MARKAKAQEDGPYTNVAAKARLKARWGENALKGPKMRADWNEVSPTTVHALVAVVGDLGGAVTLGVDKAGAGFTVAVWLGGEKVFNQWFRGDGEGVEALHQQLEDFVLDARELVVRP